MKYAEYLVEHRSGAADADGCIGCKYILVQPWEEPCKRCKRNAQDLYCSMKLRDYIPTCPFGADDCVCDPAYIKCYHPGWYKELYGDISPEEASKQECHKYTDPDQCYDDEDK